MCREVFVNIAGSNPRIWKVQRFWTVDSTELGLVQGFSAALRLFDVAVRERRSRDRALEGIRRLSAAAVYNERFKQITSCLLLLMDFDEYDYLEKTVENPDADHSAANGKNGKLETGALSDRIKTSKRRSDEDDHGYRSKRMRSEEELRVRSDRGRERGSPDRSDKGQYREQLRRGSCTYRDSKLIEEEKDRGSRDHIERHERDRERERERARGRGEQNGRDREKKYRHSEREHHSEREKEIRDRDRGCGLARRSSSVSGRLPDRAEGRERNHEKSMDIVLKDSEREGELRERDFKDRDPRRFKEKKEVVEPEADPERDQRTVFAYQISLKADERNVYEFFSRAGKVRDVQLIMDRNLRRSKGVGYIEFYDAMSVPMAIALSGQLLLGQPVMVKPSEAEKNIAQSNAVAVGVSGGLNGTYFGVARRLYVGNLHFNITEIQLRQVFEPFGHVELVQLPTDPETGQCKGFGFVQFARLEDARAAQSINGQLDIAGRIIKVSAVTDQVGMLDSGANTGDFDDEGGGLTLNARSRALLMQKLDRSGTAMSTSGSATTALANPTLNLLGPTVPSATSIISPHIPTPQLGQTTLPGFTGLYGAGAVASPAPVVEPIGPPSECLMLKNMFDPKSETEPDFEFDIREDVHDECSKFGVVKHIFVDKNSAGHVYVRFDSATSALGAQRALHGRWFAGKMITASFMSAASYKAKFPDS